MNEATFCETPRLLEVGEILGQRGPGDVVLDVALLLDHPPLHRVVERPHRAALAEDLRGHALPDLALRAAVDEQRLGRPRQHVDEARARRPCPWRRSTVPRRAAARSPTAAIRSPRMPTSARAARAAACRRRPCRRGSRRRTTCGCAAADRRRQHANRQHQVAHVGSDYLLYFVFTGSRGRRASTGGQEIDNSYCPSVEDFWQAAVTCMPPCCARQPPPRAFTGGPRGKEVSRGPYHEPTRFRHQRRRPGVDAGP